MAAKVLVTGGSGFVAGYTIRQLIGEGWSVHTTIRNLAREAEVRRVLAVDNAKLTVFAADLNADAGWAEAMAGCSHVAHIASPFPNKAPKHPDDLIVPAREGALRALRLARETGVERFVMTSSMAAIAYGHDPNRTKPFSEADWTIPDGPGVYPYVLSKFYAERAVRDWIAANPGGPEFVTVNPALILGPVTSADVAASVEAITKMLEGALPGLPNLRFGVVDVRDIAAMHVQCLTQPGLDGERFLATGPTIGMADIAAILKARLGPEARKVPTRRLPDFLVRLSALFDPMVRQVTGELGKARNVDASHARKVLGWQARPVEETIVDTARSLIDLGVVKVTS